MANAQSTWSGTSNANWSVAANWSPGPPAAGSDVIISDTTSNGLTIDDGNSKTINTFTFGTTGTRVSGFTVRTAANTLTFNGGLSANGNFAGVGPSFYGNLVIAQDQTWTIAGEIGAHSSDRGLFIREATNTGGTATGTGTLQLAGSLTKEGVGQLVLAATTVSGAGDFIVNEGALKFNAGASRALTVGGSGNITVNNSAQLWTSRNTGTMDITRHIILNDNAGMTWGGGGVTSYSTVASPIAWNGTSHTLNVAIGSNYDSSGAWTGDAKVYRTGTSTLTISGDLSGFGGSLDLNGGTTRITGAFPGDLTVTSGSANLESAVGGDLTIAAGTTFTGEVAVGGYLDLNGATIGVDPTTTASLGTALDLTLYGTNTIALTGIPTSTAPFAVLTYGGSFYGSVLESDGVWTLSEGDQNWSFIEATGTLTLGEVGYDGWIGSFDFTAFPGANLAPNGDADNDGIPNAVE